MNFLRAIAVIILACLPAIGQAEADAQAALAGRIEQQLRAAGRNQYDAVKDPGRKPVETSQFYGLEAGMMVLDVIAGGGYNTEILSAAVGPEGTVYAQNSHAVLRLINGAHHEAMLARLENDRLPNVKYMVVDTEDMPFKGTIDMAFWGFNMHDIYNADGEQRTLEYLAAIKRALKPGGVLGISDHVGVEGYDNAELHRIEARIVKDMLTKAGFVIEASSDLLSNPNDDHSRSVYADGLRYETDRILFRARRPR